MAVVLPMTACQEPEELTPAATKKGINNVLVYPTWDGYHTADGNARFNSEIDYENRVITIQVPYNIPVESDVVTDLEDYKKVWIQFNLDDNAYISP